MTVATKGSRHGSLRVVTKEEVTQDGSAEVVLTESSGEIHPDLHIGPAVASALPLRSNRGISFMGVILVGEGFLLPASGEGRRVRDEAAAVGAVSQYVSGTDLAKHARGREALDFSGWTPEKIRDACPISYQWLLEHVKPGRDISRDRRFREAWWEWGRPRPELRASLQGLGRYIATARTAKHRLFQFIRMDQMVESNAVAIACDDAAILGVLSSRVHVVWADSAGATLEDRPHYTNTTTFEPYPFPDVDESLANLFKGARLTEVEAVLESLSSLGLVLSFERAGVHRWRAGPR